MRNLYSRFRGQLPEFWQGELTNLLYLLGIKPTVNTQKSSPFSKGVVVLSADFEMAWAFRFSKKQHENAEKLGIQERKNVPILLSLFEQYNIPVTWATVGHLLLERCNRSKDSLAHPDMMRPSYYENKNWSFSEGDWYDADPCSDYQKAPAWYASDLIDMIIKSPVKHEIACHTFSHIDCSNEFCPGELFKAELKECIKAAEAKKIKLVSMVFPGGTLGNFSILKELGFSCYRKIMRYHIDVPAIDQNGLVQIPSSYALYRSYPGWTSKRYIRMATSFLKIAAKNKMVAQFWFHPSLDPWYINNVLPTILDTIRVMVDDGNMEVLTMGQLAARTRLIK